MTASGGDVAAADDDGTPRRVRVLVADDHPIVRAGIVGLLAGEPSIEVVGEAGDGAAAVDLAARLRPDVVLMDLRMPVLDGVAATARVLAGGGTRPRVLVLTTYETDDQILAAIEAGASGYLIKAAPPAEIVAGIHAVAAGTSPLSPSVATALVARVREQPVADAAPAAAVDVRATAAPAAAPSGPPAPAADAPTLTDRERDVLALVADGLSNPGIGRRLFIGEATVKSHLLRVFAKLEVSDRTRAVTRAMELGLLERPESRRT
ncbi:response regulator [Serinibacter arcticus]|uniref:Two component transcriptional regulator, LuxR family n=1 Tax=Serinibacter arcticus TaxID=1655435 RepID=A0A4Z1E2Q9_9MICO|nr:response regulator transcription factor [Serinibacter arcticus]TGO06186.1 Two component transcriptional regulator, LuxR family [Serinibacter arcticus]